MGNKDAIIKEIQGELNYKKRDGLEVSTARLLEKNFLKFKRRMLALGNRSDMFKKADYFRRTIGFFRFIENEIAEIEKELLKYEEDLEVYFPCEGEKVVYRNNKSLFEDDFEPSNDPSTYLPKKTYDYVSLEAMVDADDWEKALRQEKKYNRIIHKANERY